MHNIVLDFRRNRVPGATRSLFRDVFVLERVYNIKDIVIIIVVKCYRYCVHAMLGKLPGGGEDMRRSFSICAIISYINTNTAFSISFSDVTTERAIYTYIDVQCV